MDVTKPYEFIGFGPMDVTPFSSAEYRSWNIKAGASPGFHLRSVNPLLDRADVARSLWFTRSSKTYPYPRFLAWGRKSSILVV